MSKRYQNMTREAIAMFCCGNSAYSIKVNTMEKFPAEINRFIYYKPLCTNVFYGPFENRWCFKLFS